MSVQVGEFAQPEVWVPGAVLVGKVVAELVVKERVSVQAGWVVEVGLDAEVVKELVSVQAGWASGTLLVGKVAVAELVETEVVATGLHIQVQPKDGCKQYLLDPIPFQVHN